MMAALVIIIAWNKKLESIDPYNLFLNDFER